jgi:hypothetical protein
MSFAPQCPSARPANHDAPHQPHPTAAALLRGCAPGAGGTAFVPAHEDARANAEAPAGLKAATATVQGDNPGSGPFFSCIDSPPSQAAREVKERCT